MIQPPPKLRQIEVRCCCDPTRLYGWFLVSTDRVRLRVGERMVVRLRPEPATLDHDPFWRGCEYLELPLGIYVDERGFEHLAFRADHATVPMQQLLRADGFFAAN